MSDLFLLPSETESFGLAALEAMAAQVPVISSNAGGIPEVNIHGQTGFLSPVGDTQDMIGHALELLEDETKLEFFKKQAQQEARKYELNNILPRYEAVYEKAMAIRKPV
jgi:glycosyltransferase involved in cell wall biosynthesis